MKTSNSLACAALTLAIGACSGDESTSSSSTGGEGGATSSTTGTGSTTASGAGGEGAGPITSQCAKLQALQNFEAEPSAVAMLFTAEDCDSGIPITGLTGTDFIVQENGEALSSEAHRDVIGGRGYRVETDLLLDFSNSTLPIRGELVAGAKAFVDEILVQRQLADRVKIGVVLFDGRAELERLQLPVSDAATLNAVLDSLGDHQPVDGGSTNLNGAVRQGVLQLQDRSRSIAQKNLGGVVATGHLVVFTDGADTAGREPPTQATDVVSDARLAETAGPSGVVQTWAVALHGDDYDPVALEGLLGGDRWIFESPEPTQLPETFDAMGDRISAQVEATYLFAYCSPKRMDTHTVTLALKPTVVPESQALSFMFNAEDFEGGCDAAFFDSACDNLECGGFACGACDDETGACSPQTLRCRDFCEELGACSTTTIVNENGYEQTCTPPSEPTQCNGSCVDLASNDEHCGVCGNACTLEASYCVGGGCVCAADAFECEGVCQPLAYFDTSEEHCGGCGKRVSLECVDGAGIGAVAVRAGNAHVCAMGADGRVFCWGNNSLGQLGNGANVDSSVPGPVVGVSSATAISAGAAHGCAVTSGGSVECWGRNNYGQLGDGTAVDSNLPVTVEGIATAVDVAAGYFHTCALLAGGGVACWGRGGYGALGNGNSADSTVPILLASLPGAVAIAAGQDHSCALLADGTVRCWGAGANGQLGHGSSPNIQLTPVVASNLVDVIGIAAGGVHSCAVTGSGSAYCWGGNFDAQLGVPHQGPGSVSSKATPELVPGVSDATSISAGYSHTCAILVGGTARCWGEGEFGQLGTGGAPLTSPPVDVAGLNGVGSLSVGRRFSCAALSDGSARCWGVGSEGQLGNGTSGLAGSSLEPVFVGGL